MIEISFGKLLLLAIIALIVLGPEKLPGAARTAGALLRRMRNGWDSVRNEVEREIQAEEIKRTLREAADNVRQTHDSVRSDLNATAGQVRDAFTERQTAARIEAEAPPPTTTTPVAETATRDDMHDRS